MSISTVSEEERAGESIEDNPFAIAERQLRKAARYLELDDSCYQMLSTPMRELSFTIPVKLDEGDTKVFRGFRVQYNDALGPTKGGIRFHPDETIDTVRALAAWMTWKTSLLELPYGGGKGGVICDPEKMSDDELERLSRGYIRALTDFIGPDRDIPAPDVNTNARTTACMMDEFSKLKGYNAPGVITGKPVSLGGSLGRDDATARGGMYVLREFAKERGIDLQNSTVAIQGYGSVGSFAHKLLEEMFGANIVAVGDAGGAIYRETGLAFEEVSEHLKRPGMFSKHIPDTSFLGQGKEGNDKLLELPVDILIPAAIENAITAENAPDIQANTILELANGPTSPGAEEILSEREIIVVPDILANAGGVTVSYFEWSQNLSGYYWSLQDVHEKLDKKMTAAFHKVHELHLQEDISLRLAAYVTAVGRIVEVMKTRGWV